MQQVRQRILQRLSDGHFHSGQQLAQALGISRTAVWKHVQHIESNLGLTIGAVRGRGYRLAAPLELLDERRIRRGLSGYAKQALEAMSLMVSTASTNSCAAADPPTESGRARVWLAEHQFAGRGRRGRHWVSAFGESLYLSLAWRFDLPMSELSGLSLAAGVVVAEVLQRLGLERHSLKWPNDVMVDDRKLCGILVEAAGETGGPVNAVVGVGLNIRVSPGHALEIDRPWTDLVLAGAPPISRNQLAGMLIDALIGACEQYADGRLAPFLVRWDVFDGLCGKRVNILRGSEIITGTYRGVAASGAVVLEGPEGLSEHLAGEVSLRRADKQ